MSPQPPAPLSHPRELVREQGDHLHVSLHRGQRRAHSSSARFVIMTAGTQGGKTSYGPYWLLREMHAQGPGDYLIVTPTFQLLERKLLGEFLRLFQSRLRLGTYSNTPGRVFTLSPDGSRRLFAGRDDPDVITRVQFGYAEDPDSLESMTARAAWLDEAGQHKFKRGAWEAVLRRLSLAQGRVLITTSVYTLHWLKGLVDQAAAGDRSIEVVRFDSTANPTFPLEEYQRARRDLPGWKFDMLYRGLFQRPAGLIYDCIDESRQRIPRIPIPPGWPRFLGLDFGRVNTAACFFAQEPATDRLYLYRTYHAGSLSVPGHVRALLRGEPGRPTAVGGAPSEDEWRREFRAHGLPLRRPPISDLELGIDRVYGAWQRGEVFAFDDLDEFWEEKRSYRRALDDRGNVTTAIEDQHSFHLMDAERYILSYLFGRSRRIGRAAQVNFYDPAYPRSTIVPTPPPAHTQAEIEQILADYFARARALR